MKKYAVGFFIFVAAFISFFPRASSGVATLASFTVDRAILHTDDAELQTATLTLHTTDPDSIDDVRIAVNRGTDHPRGFFQWTPMSGFREIGREGNNTVRLRTTQSERIIDETNHTITFSFRWAASPNYGDAADNTVSYFWKESTNHFISGWQTANTPFTVEVVPTRYSTFHDVSVDKPLVYADGVDVQTARLTLNPGPDSRIDDVRIMVNPKTPNARGSFRWNPWYGFQEDTWHTTGHEYAELLPVRSERITNPDGTITFVFRWRVLPGTPETEENTVSYFWAERRNDYIVNWQTANATFTIHAPPVNHILSTGEDLSNGVLGLPVLTTVQPYSNLMLSNASDALIPLRETTRERMSSAMGNFITANTPGNIYQTVVTRHGLSGAHAYSTLKKGTTAYGNGMGQVTDVKNLAETTLGKRHRVIAVTAVHGETDHERERADEYEANLVEWQHDYETDVQAITGQTENIPLFTDQMSSWTGMGSATSGIPVAQLAAAENNPGKIIIVGPKYFLPYADETRLNGYGYRWLGEYYGKIIKKVVVDGETWTPLSPRTITRNGNVITAVFNVPVSPLVFDTDRVLAQTNYGFEYWNPNDSATIISTVTITAPDTVEITLNQTPTDTSYERLRYAFTGTPGSKAGPYDAGSARGNLRDSDATTSQYTTSSPLGYTLYNWAVIFDEEIL